MTAPPDDEPRRPTHADGIVEPLDTVIDPVEFTPRLVSLLSNALVWRESKLLREEFDLGTNEWRVISSIAGRPGMTANAATNFLGLNRAIVSKSVSTLQERGLVVHAEGRRGLRHLYLTRAGAAMHEAMRPISERGREIITEGMTPEEVRSLNALLRRMLRLLRLAEAEAAAAATADAGAAEEPPEQPRAIPAQRRKTTGSPR